jgi:hypothetical protein
LLGQSLPLIDASVDPVLAYTALHNQISILVDCGRYREAKRRLFQLRSFQEHSGGRINELKQRWEEGRVDAGCDHLERAEETLLGVRAGLAAVHRGYDAALASLDLAAVLMARKKHAGAAEVVLAAYQTFTALQIIPEGLVSLRLLKTSFDADKASRAMVEEVAAFLRLLEINPNAVFPGDAWR